MIERRVIIKDWKTAEKKVQRAGSKLLAKYKFTDYIYTDSKKNIIRARHFLKPFDPTYHKANVILKVYNGRTYNCTSLAEAKKIVKEQYPEYTARIHYTRTGQRYRFRKKTQIFIESIKEYFDSVEVESSNKEELSDALQLLKPAQLITKRLPHYILSLKPTT